LVGQPRVDGVEKDCGVIDNPELLEVADKEDNGVEEEIGRKDKEDDIVVVKLLLLL